MRQVFTSPRLENVERVATLLEEQGIEVRITDGRSYKGNARANFSYHNTVGKKQPALWIIKSEDQPRARKMLRELGLMDSTRNAPDSFLAMSFRGSDPYAATPAQKRAFRIKVGLLLGITVVLAMALMHGAKLETASVPPATTGTPHARAPAARALPVTPTGDASTPMPATTIVDAAEAAATAPANPVSPTPAALAEVIFASGLADAGEDVTCLALDGKDVPAAVIGRLRSSGLALAPASACTLPATPGQASRHAPSGRTARFLEIGSFRPEASGDGDIGTIQRNLYGHGDAPALDTLAVRRKADGWEIVGPASSP